MQLSDGQKTIHPSETTERGKLPPQLTYLYAAYLPLCCIGIVGEGFWALRWSFTICRWTFTVNFAKFVRFLENFSLLVAPSVTQNGLLAIAHSHYIIIKVTCRRLKDRLLSPSLVSVDAINHVSTRHFSQAPLPPTLFFKFGLWSWISPYVITQSSTAIDASFSQGYFNHTCLYGLIYLIHSVKLTKSSTRQIRGEFE